MINETEYNHTKIFKVKCRDCTHTIDIGFGKIYKKIEIETEFNDNRTDRHLGFEFQEDGSIRIHKLDYHQPGDSNIYIHPGDTIYID